MRQFWFIAIAFVILSLCAPLSHSSDSLVLNRILTDYENALMRVADRNQRDAASALVMLAAIGSPRYPELRDRLLADKDPEVQTAVMHAMMVIGDASPVAEGYLERAVRSPSAQVVEVGVPIIRSIKPLRIEFARIWDTARPTYLFAVYASDWGYFTDQLFGVGKARPWKDKAWQQLSRYSRQGLLARAGTREALSILISDLKTDEKAYLPAGELVDPGYLVELLKHPHESIRRYACASLNNGGNSGCADFLQAAARQGTAPKDLLAVYPLYPYLTQDALRDILHSSSLNQQERITQFRWVPWDLLRKGERELASELAKELLPLLPGQDRPSYEFLIMKADNDYRQFPDLIREVLNMPDDTRYDLRSLLPSALEQEQMPDEVADRSYDILRDWTNRNLGDSKQLSFWSEPTRFFRNALQLMGQLARGPNQEEIWNAWRQSKDPLNDYRTFIPMLSSPSKRSERIRRMIANTWRMTGSGYDLLQRVKAESGPLYVCPQFSFLTSQLSYVFWDLTEPVAEETEKLGAQLSAEYRDKEHVFLLDFLRYQGVNVDRSRDQILVDLLNKEESLPPVLKKLIAMEPGPAGANHPWRRMTSYDTVDFFFPDEYRVISFRQKGASFVFQKEWNMPDPDLSTEDQAWIRDLIAKADEEMYQQILTHPPSVVVTDGGSRSDELPILSEDALSRAESLRNSDDLHERYTVLWTLWSRRRDKSVVDTWLEDSRSPAPEVRKLALSLLMRIRCEQAAIQFLQALEDGDPALRVLGIGGVQNLRLNQAQPRVLQLLNDSDPNVRQAAATALGYLASATSRDALITLADVQTQLGLAAASSLIRYSKNEDIEAMIRAWDSLDPSSSKANALHSVLCSVTFRCQASLPNGHVVPTQTIKVDAVEWNQWWKSHRSHSRLSWLKEALNKAAQQFLNATDPAVAFAASGRLSFLLGHSIVPRSSYNKIDETDRQKFQSWWSFEKDQSLWEIFSPSYFDTGSNISLLMQIDSQRTLRHFFPRFLMACRTNHPTYDRGLYSFFVEYSGKDYGDPCLASCGAKETVGQDWIKWAQSAGLR